MTLRVILMTAIASCLAMITGTACAQEAYPSKPIRLVVPYPAGGGADTLARMVGNKLSEAFGQPIIIDNKPGANTILGSSEVARAPADGYTLLLVATALATNPGLYNLPYDTLKAFEPVAMIARVPLIIIRNEKAPYKTLADLLAAAKAKPGKLNYASYGTGSPAHLSAELLEAVAGIKMTHIPYKGSAAALSDLMGGQVELGFSSIEPALPLIVTKKVYPVAVLSKKRLTALPDVPTVAETFPDFEADGWNGIVAPAGTPTAIINKLNRAINDGVMSADVQAKFAKQSVKADPMSPEELSTLIKSQVAKWSDIVKRSGIKID
jgi:tripartite-type tricarboxylate transporter receptor subunit TctC